MQIGETGGAGVTDAVRGAARHLLEYPFRVWGFGEGIGVRALLETGDPRHEGFVLGLFASWIGKGPARSFEDHVAPGAELLTLYERTGQQSLLDAARKLAALHSAFPRVVAGVRLHRPDQPGWKRQIWVDCMHVDGPFLARFAGVSGQHEFFDEAAEQALAYARALQTPDGLFRHGWEAECGPNGQLWARGNGWALTGMIETLAALPAEHSGCSELRQRIAALITALKLQQRSDGLWHTVIDDPDTYAETTLAAMVAYSLIGRYAEHEAMRVAAEAAVLRHVSDKGELLLTSEATPVSEHKVYATRPFGVYPWGQGPLVMVLLGNQDEDRKG